MTSLKFDASGVRTATSLPMSVGAETDTEAAGHPLERHLKSVSLARDAKLYDARIVYGPALAMRLASEDAMADEVGRLPGLPSSNLMKQTLRGDIDFITFEDILNPPHEQQESKLSVHELAEQKFFHGGAPVPGYDQQAADAYA